MDIFEHKAEKEIRRSAPLADRIRPRCLGEFVGQEEILGEGKLLRRSIEADELTSMIFWGPPGTGKTTVARIIAEKTRARFVSFSAVTSGIKDVKEVVAGAKEDRKYSGLRTVLFVDEIHRFNKAQQDVFLPYVEDGTIILIGATTENPSFEVNSALLSRCRVYVFSSLKPEEMKLIIEAAIGDAERGLGDLPIVIDDEAVDHLASQSHGDARIALSGLEIAVKNTPPGEDGRIAVSLLTVEEAMQKRALMYDKGGEEHYNIISALHKSVRDSDPDAALYWLMRMLEGGEEPLYIARRLIRMAVEDIGIADPRALSVAVAAKETYHFLGTPEGELALAEAVIYLATAPKSNAVYSAFIRAKEDVKKYGALPVPLVIRNAPTRLMKDIGYGKGYKYAHDFEDARVDQKRLPDELAERVYYRPTDRGYEGRVKEWLDEFRKKVEAARGKGESKEKK
ncbi:MAG: replication-associated recombination protein A [Deltaproteobacteria bacterium]|uniref:Replication-associated recombination protein A n=1 Tax=Candidatus Zymogenus saltonus TaxID=2844893 RepID=A0A9D8PMX7_9DELT|nr:replication-associated recombination protein A [Candidatus Zymogenus saltonus]